MSLAAFEILESPRTSHEAEAMEAHVQRVAQSSLFLRAETLRKLLLYLWAHRTEEISEYAVATEALGRRSDFDPKMDASARVQISRLRRKLKDFYETEGAGDGYLLHIPMGTHVLTITEGTTPSNLLPAVLMPTDEIGPQATYMSRNLLVRPLAAACVALLAITFLLGWNLHKAKSLPLKAVAVPTRFWTAFVGVDTPVKIILPTPVFFTYPGNSNLHVRDVKVNDFQMWKLSKAVNDLSLVNGDPKLDHAYTVTSDTLAAIDLARYLDRVGLAEGVDFGVSYDSTMNLLEKSSVIAFGAHSTLQPFRDYLQSMNFSLGEGEGSVTNAHPESGEEPKYVRTSPSDNRQIEPSLVAVLPGRGPGKKLLILQSRHTSALVSMMTSKVGDSLFQKMYAAHGSPTYFEMVVMNEAEGDHIIRSWPVAMHAYTKNPPNGADVTQ
jgi:hypothetical protein